MPVYELRTFVARCDAFGCYQSKTFQAFDDNEIPQGWYWIPTNENEDDYDLFCPACSYARGKRS